MDLYETPVDATEPTEACHRLLMTNRSLFERTSDFWFDQVSEGFPAPLRPCLWYLLLDVEKTKTDLEREKMGYQQLFSMPFDNDTVEWPCFYLRDIVRMMRFMLFSGSSRRIRTESDKEDLPI